ncbi:uncharacterized protein Atac3 [Epargyreus clarus]|uniref:uncharacterized protein Atac3 n=1 Tax=Epargyreus clarus TaxID=520877 RepID=UPI003C2E7895
MTSDLCEEDVVQIASPQILTTEALPSPTGSAGPAGAGYASRVAASSAAVELGRRLLLAARAGDTPTVLDLMAKGAPFSTDWLGTSPLHLAAANAHTETCAVLLRAGVSRDSRTKVERTPLHIAAHAGHADVVSLLLDHGAIVDCRDMLRMTPLHWAAARGHAGAARALLRRGADVRARCKFRHTPRRLALRHRHLELAALLERAEAEADAVPPHAAPPRAAPPPPRAGRAARARRGRGRRRYAPASSATRRAASRCATATSSWPRCSSAPRPRPTQVRSRKFRHTPRRLALRHRHLELAALLERAEAEADAEQMAEETRKTLSVESLTKTPEIKIEKPKIKLQHETIKQPKLEPTLEAGIGAEAGAAGAAAGADAAAAALLRKHGITLLPTDDGSTVLNAIQSGRTVVLSDAGKLMLKESGCSLSMGGVTPVPVTVATAGAGAAGSEAAAGGKAKGVVLTATPVRTPPHGVKVFSVNNRLLLPATAATTATTTVTTTPHKIPVKKIIDPHDLQQMKFVQLSSEAGGRARAGVRARRPPVKIIMNKTNFTKLIANANKSGLISLNNGVEVTNMGNVSNVSGASVAEEAAAEEAGEAGCACACAGEVRRLRAELAAARARLARYEP